MSLTTPPSVQKLQTALHDKAKGSPNFRFYALYDKVYREDVMAFAYECCKANRGAAGVDGQTFEDIEEYGVQKWLGRTDARAEKKVECIDRSPYGGCIYPSQTGNKDR
jgi:RNA-directed DNA polymerase